MHTKKARGFFIPDWQKAALFLIFMLIAGGAYVQSWALDGDESGAPKPPLYDVLDPFPFYVLWIFSALPLIMLDSIIMSSFHSYTLSYFMSIFWITQGIYFYLLTCLIVFLGRRFWGIYKSSSREFRKGLGISFLLVFLAFVISLGLNNLYYYLFPTMESQNGNFLFLMVGSSKGLWFLILNSIGIWIVKDKDVRGGMCWGYLWIFLIGLFWMVMAFLAIGYHDII